MKRIILSLLMFFSIETKAIEDVIIANKVVSEKSIHIFELQSIFLLNKLFWDDGTPIVPIILDVDSKVHKNFVLNSLNLKPSTYSFLIQNKLSSGSSNKMIIAESESDILAIIMRTPGSISYLENVILIRKNNEIKVISINY